MSDLPANLTSGKVVGRLLLPVADATGADPAPLPAAGTLVKFKPRTVSKVLSPDPATVVQQETVCTIDAGGHLLDPQGQPGVWLETGIYRVTYSSRTMSLAMTPSSFQRSPMSP